MSIFDKLKQLASSEISGVKDIYHGLNPLDRQGFTPPQRPVQYPLYQRPESPPGVKNLPLQGGVTGGLQRANSSPMTPLSPAIFNPNYLPFGVDYNLLNGAYQRSNPYGSPKLRHLAPMSLPLYLERR